MARAVGVSLPNSLRGPTKKIATARTTTPSKDLNASISQLRDELGAEVLWSSMVFP
jgi:hypothetical protein